MTRKGQLMNLNGSNNKHPLNPKRLPSIDQRGCIKNDNITPKPTSVARKENLMDISVSKAKNTLNPKSLPSIGQRKYIKKL